MIALCASATGNQATRTLEPIHERTKAIMSGIRQAAWGGAHAHMPAELRSRYNLHGDGPLYGEVVVTACSSACLAAM